MRIIKCYFQSCKETIETDIDEAPQATGATSVLAAGATFGHAQYQRVPFAWRDEHKLSGKPWTCAYHHTMVGATLALTDHEERQRQSLVSQIRTAKMIEGEDGWYAQTPPAPVPERIIHEDDGSVRVGGTMMRWFTQEQMLAALSGDSASPGGMHGRTTPIPEASDDER
jgi:hypothetical protein